MPTVVSLAVVAASVVACLAWAVTTPLAGTPDERQHVVYAASLWQGQLTSTDRVEETPGRVSTESLVTVPGAYADLAARYRCFWTNNPSREGCVLPLPTDGTPTEATTRAGRYPPAYYLAVGAGTRSSSAVVGITTARVLSAVLAGVPLGLGLLVAVRRRRAVLLPLAVTPYTLFLAGLVNPSGWEITSAIALWVGALAWLEDPDDRTALLAVAVGTVGTVLARPIGPALAAGILLTCAVARWRPEVRPVLRTAPARATLAVAGGCVAIAVGWLLWRDPTGALTGTPEPGVGTLEAAATILGDLPTHLRQMIWNAVGFPPTGVAVAWLALAALAILAALVLGTRRERVAIGMVALGSVLLPIGATVQSVAEVGYVWQGRYGQPVSVGLVVLASWVVAGHLTPATRRRLLLAGGVSTAVVHAWGLLGVAAHWTAWPDAPSGLLVSARPDGWSPPLPPLLVAGVLALAVVATAALAARTGGLDGPDAPPT